MQEHQDNQNSFCPNCGVGHTKLCHKPYLRLFLGQLFTIPNALCYQCDMCNYCEFDESALDIVSDMIFSARRTRENNDKSRPLSSPSDDNSPTQQKPPQF